MTRRGGFSLLEVIAALVVFSVGAAASLRLVQLASERLSEATRLAEAVRRTAAVADSLEAHGVTTAGEQEEGWGRVRWTVVSETELRVEGVIGDSAEAVVRLELAR